jgi:glucosamine--fructose-6-phosphate aminotransferase (isomerizing)
MCGIVGALAHRDVSSILLEGLYRLEYRGYDSAGIALIDDNKLARFRALGKVRELESKISADQPGHIGIAHTRWATHGEPSESNAHPHISSDRIAVVHNGIIENYKGIRERLLQNGYEFSSETDSEVVAHLIDSYFEGDLFAAVRQAVDELEGAFALGIIAVDDPRTLVACRRGNPLVVGIGIKENFVASDVSALLPVTNRFVYLEEGDYVVLSGNDYQVYDAAGVAREPEEKTSEQTADAASKGEYRHYMQKEIHEQGRAVAECLEGRISDTAVLDNVFGFGAADIFERVENIQIVACGTSYIAGMVARYWIESLLDLPCQVEVASEFRYRKSVVQNNTLFVTLSQSGETADTLSALRSLTSDRYCGKLCICNVPESSLVRESDLAGRFAGSHPATTRRNNHASHRRRAEFAATVDRATDAAGTANRNYRRGFCRQAARVVSWPRRTLPDCDGGRAEAQGNFLYPCRGLPGGRTQARSASAGRRRNAGGRRGAQ